MDIKSCLGVILAGGRSTRMAGPDKALLKLGGETLISRAARRLQDQIDSVIISSSNTALSLAKLEPPVVANLQETAGHGPLSGIFSAMHYARAQGYQAIVTIAVDTPFFPDSYMQQMTAGFAHSNGRPVMAASSASWHPTFGLWPVALQNALERHLHIISRTTVPDRQKSILGFARQHKAQSVLFPPVASCCIDPFFNMNTPADFTRAQAFAARIEEKQQL